MLRHVRDSLDDALAGRPAQTPLQQPGVAEYTVTDTGEILWMPTGLGWRWLHSALLGEILLSRHTKTWRRLRQCGHDGCRATFYDSSWNISSVCRHR
jgi:predicted RNA-binding Zn ribbon-like protein